MKTTSEPICYTGEIPVSKLADPICPFANLLDMVAYYYDIAKKMDIDELDCFIDNKFAAMKDRYPQLIDAEEMSVIIQNTYLESLRNTSSKEWMTFDEGKLDSLLKNDFFNEYNSNILAHKNFKPTITMAMCYNHTINIFERKYGLLELYTYTKLQSIAASVLPENRSYMLWQFWCYEDMLPILIKNGFYCAVSTVYRRYGKNWFCRSKYGNQGFDPILYIWGYYALSACQARNEIGTSKLRIDLMDIYSEYLILCTRSDSLSINEKYTEILKSGIENFDSLSSEYLSAQIKELQTELLSKEHKTRELLKDRETLQKSCDELRKQIHLLQNDENRNDTEKVQGILERLYAAMPDDINFDKTMNKLADIWEKLSDTTQMAIKNSLGIYGILKATDCATFPLICSLEQEFNLNFFEPFKQSKQYKAIKNSFCRNQKYAITHKVLFAIQDHPTMGNIPFIGRAVKDKKALAASDVIMAYSIFLGKEKDAFCCLCEAVDHYRVGLKQYSLVDLRNGLAHGNSTIEKNCDASCFNDVKKMLYDPPIQIMYSIVANSKK